MSWIRRKKTDQDPITVAPIVMKLEDWPSRQLGIVHRHEYAPRPPAPQARTFQTWIEVNGMPVTARLTIDTWGSGGYFPFSQYWRHFLMEVNDGKWEPADIVLRVIATS